MYNLQEHDANFITSHPKRFEVRGICTQRYQKADSSFIEVLTISPKTKEYIHPVLQGPGIDLGPVVAIYAQGAKATEERRQCAELQVEVLPGPLLKSEVEND